MADFSQDVADRFAEITAKKYADQAVWFLNGFFGELSDEEKEKIYQARKLMVELDLQGATKKGEDGQELDKFYSAVFLERLNSAMTALERQEALKTIDVDSNGQMALIEYLLWQYKKPVTDVVDAPQGADSEAMAKAEAALKAVQAQLAEVQEQIEKNKQAIAELAEEEKKLAEAEAELQAALDELKKQEQERADKIASLEEQAKLGGVKGARAANELATTKEEDPLPLRRAKITQEAALRKVQKQKQAVEQSRLRAEAQQVALEKANDDLLVALSDCEKEIRLAAQKMDAGKGAIWWMQRELFEADAYLSSKKQKYDHSKPFQFVDPKA